MGGFVLFSELENGFTYMVKIDALFVS